jgi:hypothetical protein
MTTKRQSQSNGRNAKASTGPTSRAGKRRSGRNATTHGLTATDVTVPGEDPARFQRRRQRMHREEAPATELDKALLDQVAAGFHRLERAAAYEAGLVARHIYERAAASAIAEARSARRSILTEIMRVADKSATVLPNPEKYEDAYRKLKEADAELEAPVVDLGRAFQELQGPLANLARHQTAIARVTMAALTMLQERKASKAKALGSAEEEDDE